MIAIRNELFSRSDIPAIPLLITPILIHRSNFPSTRYIELIDFYPTFSLDSILYKNWKLYQLYTFLLIIDHRIEQLPNSLTKRIVSIIRYFIHDLSKIINYNQMNVHDNEIDEQDRNEPMDVQSGGLVN